MAVAHFTEIPPVMYSLTVGIVGEGTTDPEPGVYQYEEGTEVPLSATAAGGWEFDRWVIDGADVFDPNPTVTMDGDVEAVAHFTEIPPLSPKEALEDLIDYIEGLGLERGIENSLVRTLEAAINSLDRGQTNAVANRLRAFISQVQALANKKLSEEQASILIERARHILCDLQ